MLMTMMSYLPACHLNPLSPSKLLPDRKKEREGEEGEGGGEGNNVSKNMLPGILHCCVSVNFIGGLNSAETYHYYICCCFCCFFLP